jgi:S-formylglutathione hydrolase
MASSSFNIKQLSKEKVFDGYLYRFSHTSNTLGGCTMNFHIYLPPAAVSQQEQVPLLWFLSGLTCTDENFVQKAGPFQYLAQHKLAVIAPDTSPRGDDVPDVEPKEWDFGKGAGFYVDATQQPYNTHYKMYSYITSELPQVVKQLPDNIGTLIDHSKYGISGHSMGGHGALQIYLKNQDKYKSVSAFAPISNPTHTDCSWGQKNFSRYLGSDNKEAWKQYSSLDLILSQDISPETEVYVDQGTEDSFLHKGELRVDELKKACEQKNVKHTINMREGYSHGYWFVQTFIGDHIAHHANKLH